MKSKFLILLACLLINGMLNAQQLDHVLGDLIIQLSSKVDQPATLLPQYKQINGKAAHWKVKKQLNKEMNIWLVQFDFTAVNEYDALRSLRSHSLVKKAQFNHLLQKRNTPNDPFFGEHWNWINTGANNGIVDADIDADEAWDITTGGLTPQGDTIVIAILDEGVELEHDDLKANLWKNYGEIPDNGIDDDNNGYIDDFHGWNVNTESDGVDHSVIPNGSGHGSEVASIVGAVGNNSLLITGINWDVKLMIVAPYGIGSDNEASALSGYSYVLNMRKRYNETNGQEGAFVVATNSSWGIDGLFPEDAPIWCEFYDLLGQEGIINTVATVNNNIDIDAEGDLPTTCTSNYLIGVSNSTNRDRKSPRAGYGPQSIDLFAPGDDIPILTRFDSYTPQGSGTSYAAPTVAGVVGLLYAAPCDNFISVAKQNPMEAAILARRYLLDGVDRKNDLTSFSVTSGRLNAHNSLQELLKDCNSCSTLFGIAFEEQTKEDQLTINWVADTTSAMTIRYRIEGTTDWASVENVSAPYTFQQLQVCSNYEFEFALQCENEPLTFSETFKAATDGCCNAPTSLTELDITDTSLSLEWASILSATDYMVEWKVTSSNNWVSLTTLGASNNFTGLSPCTQYDIRVRPLCSSKDTEFSSVFQFTTRGCGACTDATYCTSKGADAISEWIEQVKINGLDNSSGRNSGFGEFTDISTTLQTFTSYEIEVIPGFRDTRFPENYKVWIDYNQDGEFDNSTEVAVETPISTTADFKKTITIPENAQPGLTRMRIAMVADFESIARTPCATYNFGEVEDYCVSIITGDFQCLSPQGVQLITTDQTTAQLDWEIGTSIEQFTIQYRPVSTSAWQEIRLTATDDFIIPDLIPCLQYEYQVLSNCTNGIQSDWSPINTFSTLCDCAAPTNVQFKQLESGIEITWDELPIASTYNVFYANIDGSNVREITVDNNSFIIQDVPDCVDLNIAITPVCLDDLGATTEFPSINSCKVSTTEFPAIIEKLEIYPNPFKVDLSVALTLKQPSPITVSVWNLAGQQVTSNYEIGKRDTAISFQLPTAHLKAGIYFVNILTEEGRVVSKVVKME